MRELEQEAKQNAAYAQPKAPPGKPGEASPRKSSTGYVDGDESDDSDSPLVGASVGELKRRQSARRGSGGFADVDINAIDKIADRKQHNSNDTADDSFGIPPPRQGSAARAKGKPINLEARAKAAEKLVIIKFQLIRCISFIDFSKMILSLELEAFLSFLFLKNFSHSSCFPKNKT